MQFLRSEIDKTASSSGLDINWIIDRLSTFLFEFDFSKTKKDYIVNENWTKLLSVYHNILYRGFPTYPTFDIEKLLISEASMIIPIEEVKDERNVTFRDQLVGEQKEEWLNHLIKAHLSIDFQCKEQHGNPGSDEERIFLEYASEKIGPSAFQIIESQRLFSFITKSLDKEEVNSQFYNQRIDFSLETKDTKMIFEIDGEQHKEEKQAQLDKQRQEYLEKNNWEVNRIPAWTVRQKQISIITEKLQERFSNDPFLIATKDTFDNPLTTSKMGEVALLLVLAPIAIARIQWALNWALRNGKINFSQPSIKIAVIENDIPCAYLAIWDYIKTLNHLKILAGIESTLPRIELEIFRNKDFESFPNWIGSLPAESSLKVNVSRIDELRSRSRNQYDLVIEISTLHVGAKAHQFKHGQKGWINISSVFSPRGTSRSLYSAAPINYDLKEDNTEDLLFFLQWIFRKKMFLDGQLKILKRTLANKDVIGLLPTGGGKSLCYQLSALLQPGMTLIVDPLISLMHDQVFNLRQLQIDKIAYLSSDQNEQEKKEIIEQMVQGLILMLFISPERLQIKTFRENLGDMCIETSIPYIVIDEAHCISEWGHDFRPSYLQLANIARRVCQHKGVKPSIVGLTGTASWVVLSDMQREMDITEEDAVITPNTFDRKELMFEVVKCHSGEKKYKTIFRILQLPERFNLSKELFFKNENAGIVFCPHVNGKYGISEVSKDLQHSLGDLIHDVPIYSGKRPKNRDPIEWKHAKMEYQKAFKENKAQLMVATKAFGMGIDKPNIRFTIHYNIPTSLEAFYQEAGRAGRDKKTSFCIIMFSGDLPYWNKLNAMDLSINELKSIDIPENQRDDVYRLLYLHGKTWGGPEKELQNVMSLVDLKIMPEIQNLGLGESKRISVQFKGAPSKDDLKIESDTEEESQVRTEKALYRLSMLGLISEYTIHHNSKQFEVEIVNRSDDFVKAALLSYFERYKPPEYRKEASQRIELCIGQTVLEKCVKVMLEFVYKEIEKKRRRAILHMAEVAETSTDNEQFRIQLLGYLEKTEFTQSLIEISRKIEPLEWAQLALKVVDIDSARQLLFGCGRALESYPDHPGLWLLSAFARILLPKPQDDIAMTEFQRATRSLARFSEKEDTPKAIVNFIEMINRERPTLTNDFCYILIKEFQNREIARIVLKNVDSSSESGMLSLKILLENTLDKTKLVRTHLLGGELS
jgi:ATP-dependent DNA helicase RecQ